ncbi:MAG: hypothetical protein IT174_05925 [Acidobacteria bacterium]|nr:hypothetical protein [Acidobacteriota bacterium]
MNIRNFLFVLISAAAFLLSGCGTEPTANNAGNAANGGKTNSNTANSASPGGNSAVAVTTPTPGPVTNDAPTLTPVYKAYCAAVVKQDDAAIRKFYDAETLKNFEEQMKESKIKKLSEYVDPVTIEVCEVSNERIKGDKAVAKVKTISYPNGFEVLFVKENGEWKMSSLDPGKAF